MASGLELPPTSRLGSHTWTTVAVLTVALIAWLAVFVQLDGMDAGPGTDLGSFGWYLGAWATMMAAMMLPSAAPMIRLYSRLADEREPGRGTAQLTAVLVAAYLAVWTSFGLLAFGIYRLVLAVGSGSLAWDRAGPWVAGAAVVAAGLYELTPLKRVCLRHCRSPVHFLIGHWRGGTSGAARLGVVHGLYCGGCCWGLMLILFAIGIMSLAWMLVIAGVILTEKLLPGGERLSHVFGVAFVALGLWIALAPGSVPWLTDPSGPMTQMTHMG